MSLESIVNVTITSNSRGVSRKSFGVPAVVGKHDAWGERFRIYTLGTALVDLVSDGIVAGSPIYKAVQGLASNTPKPKTVVVGRLVSDFTQQVTLTVGATVTVGDIYTFDVRAPNGGTVTAISYTAQTGDTATLVATAIAALVNAITDLSAASVAAVITVDADNTNEMWQFEGIDETQILFEETTADSSLATEVGQIDTLYPDWYELNLADCPSKARITALAAWIETKEKIFGATTYDGINLDPASTTSVMYALNAASYNRTFTMMSGDQNSRAASTWAGNRLPIDPGASTWAYKELSGTIVDSWTTTAQTAMADVAGNYYITVGGLPVTIDGRMASGEWIDAIRGRDWLTARMREAVFGLLANAPKIPYTDKGAEAVATTMNGVLQEGVAQGYLAADPAPFVTVPLVADVSDANKIARILPDVYFEATLAGAIHAVTINGVLKV